MGLTSTQPSADTTDSSVTCRPSRIVETMNQTAKRHRSAGEPTRIRQARA